MSTEFCTSKTKINLMRAFAGESQARNRYTFAKEMAEKQQKHIMSKLFGFTADQERAHAKVFFDHLQKCAGENIMIDAGYPVDDNSSLCQLAEAAVHNETEEAEDIYPKFAADARDEGFAKIAQDFENIAKVEKTHAQRFKTFRDCCEQGKLFSSDKTERWTCLNCGYILESDSAPKNCPVCGEDQSYFIRLEWAAWGI